MISPDSDRGLARALEFTGEDAGNKRGNHVWIYERPQGGDSGVGDICRRRVRKSCLRDHLIRRAGTPAANAGNDPAFANAAYLNNTTTPSVVTMDGAGGSAAAVLDVTRTNGTGGFGTTQTYAQSVAAPGGPWDFAVGPINGNPLAEDVVEDESSGAVGPTYVFLNNGSGAFSTSPTQSLTTTGFQVMPALGDFNGDHHSDVVVASNVSESAVSRSF